MMPDGRIPKQVFCGKLELSIKRLRDWCVVRWKGLGHVDAVMYACSAKLTKRL